MRWAAGRCAAHTGLAALALLAAGCQGPGAGIADRIRAADSPIVREVVFSRPGLEGGGDRITIQLVDEATDAQALDFWCQVVIPAGAAQLGTDHVGLYRGTHGGQTYGVRVIPDAVCPSPTPPSPMG